MSDYESDNNDDESIDLLNDEPLSYVPETETDTCKQSQSQQKMLHDMYSSDDDKKMSHLGKRKRRVKTSSQRKNSYQIKVYYHSSRHNKGNSSIASKKSIKVISIPLPDELTNNSDRYETIVSLSSKMK